MKRYEELSTKSVSETEAEVRAKWEKEDILQKCIDNRDNDPYFVFYDGPATANGHPGLHHMVAKFLKDTFCKYKTMQGYKVIRKIGWDTHGLPVELEVEKKLGFKNKTDIEKYGIKEFNEKCRESVWSNEESFSNLTKYMGQFIDLENPYVTYDNDYIETEWWILKKFFDEGLFYEGNKVLPYCTRCGTGLASHEVAQGYKEVTVQTVMVPLKRKDEDAYFLAWTTTAWTLLANVALTVNPKEEYVKLASRGNNFIVGKKLASAIFGDDYKILETYKGKDLEYVEYEPLMPYFKPTKKAFFVTCADYVTMEDGTGVVHSAPAFGADDAEVGKKYKLPFYNPVGLDGKYTEGPWKGESVLEVEDKVITWLKDNDKLFKKQKMVHNYPHCWRCGTPLLYYSKLSYYLEITKIKDKIVEANKTVNWYPAFVGEKRFGNWLEDLKDWAISRNRYWGTPLPFWICDECGHETMVGSRKELVDMAIEDVDESIDLHRPFVDDVHLKCPKCGKKMTRVKDVIDCWFDSGSMPFSQYHYPFENKELWETQFPADYICEGIDQTRGWFYTLMVISVFLKGCSPYKNVLVNDLLLDAEGKKMSKSKGNIVEPFTTMKEYGADTVRFYLPYVSPVWTPLKFDMNGLKEVYSKFFNPLRNTYNFFCMYANTDDIDIKECSIPVAKRDEIDKWMLSKYNTLIKDVTNAYEEYDLNKVVRYVTTFVSDDLSNWYIRRNRNRFWGSELNDSKKAVYMTTYEVLEGLCRLIAPVVPYISEEIYTKLTKEDSVHTADFPKCNETLINKQLEEKMTLVRNLISIGRYVREENNIKVRQPLSEILLDSKNKTVLKDLVELIGEELNVKKVTFVKDLTVYMNLEVKPNFKEVGKVFGSKINDFKKSLENLSSEEVSKLYNGKDILIDLVGEKTTVTKDMVDIRVNAKEGFNVGTENNDFVILNTNLTPELVDEGIAREFVSKVQQLRKNMNLDVSDRISLEYAADSELTKSLINCSDYVMNETLCKKFTEGKVKENELDINGNIVYVKLERL